MSGSMKTNDATYWHVDVKTVKNFGRYISFVNRNKLLYNLKDGEFEFHVILSEVNKYQPTIKMTTTVWQLVARNILYWTNIIFLQCIESVILAFFM